MRGVGVVDYGSGNTLSVMHALEWVGAAATLCEHPEQLLKAERIVLPGVGAFRDCIENLTARGFTNILDELVRQKGRPILGICLGMQVMAQRSFEGGEFQGLGWFEAEVVRLKPADPEMRVPQIGWNDVSYRQDSPLFSRLPAAPDFYFVHSYHIRCDNDNEVEATCDYGGRVTAAVRKGNVAGTQFHPEKSQDHGLKVLENFLRWKP